ncbi:MAG: hypothetical protein ACYDBJ_00350, partial [Aggregatilineales bacterium]
LTRHDARTLLLLLLVLPLIGIFLATLHYDQTFNDRGHMLVHLDTRACLQTTTTSRWRRW